MTATLAPATDLAAALDLVKSRGYVALKAESYRRVQERQRLAECRLEYEIRNREGAEAWARSECTEQRRLRDRLTFVYGVARSLGASTDDLALTPEGGY